MSTPSQRRLGDAIEIPGEYQHRALLEGPAVQRAWHREKLELLDWFFSVAQGERVLDVGCGSGVFAHRLAAHGCDVLGVDANPRAVAYARATFAANGLAFREGYLDALDLPSASFDAATCMEIVEHVEPFQVAELLATLHRVLRPGGRLLLSTPNYRGVWPAVEWLADRFGSTARMDADQHINRYHRRRLCEALRKGGFTIERVRTYSTFSPFAAAVSTRASQWLGAVERRVDLPFGNLLVVAATRSESRALDAQESSRA